MTHNPVRHRAAAAASLAIIAALLAGCSAPIGPSTPAQSSDEITSSAAPALPPAPAENPLCPVATASGAAQLIGGSSVFLDDPETRGDASCESVQFTVGVAYVWVFSPDSQYAQENGSSPAGYIEKQTEQVARISKQVSTGSDAEGAWAEYRASDGSRPMVDVRSNDGALVVLSITPVAGGPGTVADVRAIAAKIASTLDVPQTLAYAAAHRG
jgi:hypothetical protein